MRVRKMNKKLKKILEQIINDIRNGNDTKVQEILNNNGDL